MAEAAVRETHARDARRNHLRSARDVLVQQYGVVYYLVARNVEGITQDGSLAPATGGGNTANWILAHLVNVHNEVMKLVGAPPVWQSPDLARARYDRQIRDAKDAIDWDTLVERFSASREACISALSALSEDALAETVTDSAGKPWVRVELLSILAIHQCYHAGQLGMSRRAAGLKAAILAPGQTAPI